MKKKIIIGIIILVIAVIAILWYRSSENGQTDAALYKVEPVKRGDLEALIVTTGNLNPVTTVEVGSQVSGRIEMLLADFNSVVKKNQVIAKLDQELFLTKVKQNEANYESAVAGVEKAKFNVDNLKKQYERTLQLFEKQLVSYETKENVETQYLSAKSDLLSANAKLQQAKSQLDSSKVDLAYTVITSPVDGVVISRNVNVGQTVAASFQAPVLFQIADDLTKMQVECSVDEADIGKVKENQKVKFSVEAYPDEDFIGIVRQVRYSPQIIQNVVTYTTIVEVDNPEMKLRPGMTATVSIIVGKATNALLVPNTALRFKPELSSEEMAKLFEQVRGNNNTPCTKDHTARADASGMRNQTSGTGFPSSSTSGGFNFKNKNISRVWTADEKGNLKPVFIKTGITDNTLTEVIGGDLKEGQEIITASTTAKKDGPPGPPGSTGSMGRMIRMIH